MKKRTLSFETLKRVKERASQLPILKNSIRNGEGYVVGFIGEEVVKDVLHGEIKDTFDYDIIYNGMTKVEVKTKEITVPPRSHFEFSVADCNSSQKCDEYAFVFVLKNNPSQTTLCGARIAWYAGKISKSDFYEAAVFHKKGEVDPAFPNFVFKADCWNIAVSKLRF